LCLFACFVFLSFFFCLFIYPFFDLDIAYWGFLKSGAKYELFRLSQSLGEVLNPTINNEAINTRLALRVYDLPVEAIPAFFQSFHDCSFPVSIHEAGFDFENGKGVPIVVFSTIEQCVAMWTAHRRTMFSKDGHDYTVQLSRIQLRRAKQKHASVSIPSWPTKKALEKKVQEKISTGHILVGHPLPPFVSRDVLLPGGNVVVGERLVKVLTFPPNFSDEEVSFDLFMMSTM
jgi:hypothetical protein